MSEKKKVCRADWIREFEASYARLQDLMRKPCNGCYDIMDAGNPCAEFNEARDWLDYVRYLAMKGIGAIVWGEDAITPSKIP